MGRYARRTILSCLVVGFAGCASDSLGKRTEPSDEAGLFGYVRTNADNYTLLDCGADGDGVWVDVRYDGSRSGTVQYKIHVKDGDVYIGDSGTKAVDVTPEGAGRVRVDNKEFTKITRQKLTVYLEIVNEDEGASSETETCSPSS